MALKRPPSAIEFTFRVEMQHYSCDVTPVGAFGVRGAVSATSGSSGGICMGRFSRRLSIDQL
jgi:hypothetical protein